jgi:hypothetical protein
LLFPQSFPGPDGIEHVYDCSLDEEEAAAVEALRETLREGLQLVQARQWIALTPLYVLRLCFDPRCNTICYLCRIIPAPRLDHASAHAPAAAKSSDADPPAQRLPAYP